MDKEAQKTDLALRLLHCCRNELYSLYPYLDGAFATLPCRPDAQIPTLGTDGSTLLFCPDCLISVYGKLPQVLRHGYLHVLLHLLYLHPFRRGDRDTDLWNLACDMAVAQVLDRERQPRLQLPEQPLRRAVLDRLGPKPRSAEALYSLLDAQFFPQPVEALAAAFLVDDHGPWNRADEEGRRRWQAVLAYTGANKKRRSRRAGTRAGSDREQLEALEPGTYDYRAYLQQFAVPREELDLDMDSFDYIYYHFGMEHYGNLPLIEPLEYREGHKLEELVIAIDTSGSCDRETVASFLGETYRILSSRENFFRRMRVVLIQCDCLVQSVAVIHSEEEWKNYSRSITIQGRGGTDFTPVFRYVEEQQRLGKLQKLKALLYFTDGDGFFPREPTPYETAFVFLQRSDKMEVVPSWARVLLINGR